MANYYAVLGITKNASDDDIKVAFRKLAKLYHPDKNPNNPNAKILFESVLKAYHTLINPISRKRYDLGYSQTQFSSPYTAKGGFSYSSKKRTVTEQEKKDRVYYQNYYKTKQQQYQSTTVKNSYSDYKYILFATPLAVALLMLIIYLFTDVPRTTNTLNTIIKKDSTVFNSKKLNN